MTTALDPPALAELHAGFLALLPRIERHGRVYFRHLRPVDREEAVAEMVGLSWKWYLGLVARGKDPAQFPSTLATFAARAVRCGRRVAGMERPKDALSPLAQTRHHFLVQKLPDCSTVAGNPLEEALQANTLTPVPDQVAFRSDFPAWLRSLPDRDWCIAQDLMVGGRTQEVADRFGLCPGRVSQLRREFCLDWRRFCGDLPAGPGSVS